MDYPWRRHRSRSAYPFPANRPHRERSPLPFDFQGDRISIRISDDHLRSWGHPCPGTLVPRALFEAMVSYDHTTEDNTYGQIPITSRLQNTEAWTTEEALARLEDRENIAVQMEAENNARLGTVYSVISKRTR
jgi:hypothetical protein